jgi:hypothetical protein
MLVSINHRFANNFTFFANYTYANCISDFDFGAALAGSTNSQLFNRHADWGPCIFDTRHNFNTSFVAASSWKVSNKFVNQLINNWQLAPLIHASSGQPLNVTVGSDRSLTGLGNDRPIQVASNVYATSATSCKATPFCVPWLDPAAFANNPLGAYGDLGRNALRGPHNVNVDVSLSRIFKIRERLNLQARADFFNVLNHTNFVGGISPGGTVTTPTTLQTNFSTTTFGQVQNAFDPRIIQFSMKLNF